jgi:nitroreductase
MELAEAIRTRRTHKVYGPDPVPREVLEQLIELATWAPNHHLTNPWRFRVLGPGARERLRAAADAQVPDSGAKLDRAPTLVAVSAHTTGDPVQDEEDLLSAGCAAYVVLLAAHDRGLAGYWRTPAVLRTPEGRAALGMDGAEHPIGLLHLGPARQPQRAPERAGLDEVAVFLD